MLVAKKLEASAFPKFVLNLILILQPLRGVMAKREVFDTRLPRKLQLRLAEDAFICAIIIKSIGYNVELSPTIRRIDPSLRCRSSVQIG